MEGHMIKTVTSRPLIHWATVTSFVFRIVFTCLTRTIQLYIFGINSEGKQMAVSGWWFSNVFRGALHLVRPGKLVWPRLRQRWNSNLHLPEYFPCQSVPGVLHTSSMKDNLTGLFCLLLQRQTMHRISHTCIFHLPALFYHLHIKWKKITPHIMKRKSNTTLLNKHKINFGWD